MIKWARAADSCWRGLTGFGDEVTFRELDQGLNKMYKNFVMLQVSATDILWRLLDFRLF